VVLSGPHENPAEAVDDVLEAAGVLLPTPVMSLSINKFNLVSGTGAGLGLGARCLSSCGPST
jgi:hypothetical protein